MVLFPIFRLRWVYQNMYEMYDEYGTGSHPNSNHYSDGGYDVYQQQTPQHHDLDMDRRLSLQQQISSNRWV